MSIVVKRGLTSGVLGAPSCITPHSSKCFSEHTVAERLADAERKRTARAVIDRPSTGLTLPVDRLHLLLTRTLPRLADRTRTRGQSATPSAGAVSR